MVKATKVNLFSNGNSQAVRLPKGFDFPRGGAVYLQRDEQTGDVLISRYPGTHAWGSYFALIRTLEPLPACALVRTLNIPVSRRAEDCE